MPGRRSFLRETRGVSATEFAVVAPVLVIMALGIINGWSFANQALNTRAAAKAGANYLLQGGGTAAVAETVALTAWVRPPPDAAISVVENCLCGGAAAACDAVCAGSNAAPASYFTISASGSWIPPAPVRIILESRPLHASEVIRVR